MQTFPRVENGPFLPGGIDLSRPDLTPAVADGVKAFARASSCRSNTPSIYTHTEVSRRVEYGAITSPRRGRRPVLRSSGHGLPFLNYTDAAYFRIAIPTSQTHGADVAELPVGGQSLKHEVKESYQCCHYHDSHGANGDTHIQLILSSVARIVILSHWAPS